MSNRSKEIVITVAGYHRDEVASGIFRALGDLFENVRSSKFEPQEMKEYEAVIDKMRKEHGVRIVVKTGRKR